MLVISRIDAMERDVFDFIEENAHKFCIYEKLKNKLQPLVQLATHKIYKYDDIFHFIAVMSGPQVIRLEKELSVGKVADSIRRIAVSADFKKIAVGTNSGLIVVINLITNENRVVRKQESSKVNFLSFSPDGEFLVIVYKDQEVSIVNKNTTKKIADDGIFACFNSLGHILIYNDSKFGQVVNVSGQCLRQFECSLARHQESGELVFVNTESNAILDTFGLHERNYKADDDQQEYTLVTKKPKKALEILRCKEEGMFALLSDNAKVVIASKSKITIFTIPRLADKDLVSLIQLYYHMRAKKIYPLTYRLTESLPESFKNEMQKKIEKLKIT